MIIHHACSLHEGVDDGRANEREAGFLQGAGHGLGFFGDRRNFLKTLPGVLDWLVINELPEKRGKANALFLQFKVASGIVDHRTYFESITDDARVLQQALLVLLGKAGDGFRIKVGISVAIALLLSQDGDPAQTCLLAVQAQLFKQRLVIVLRAAPDGVVVMHVEWVGATPGAAFAILGHNSESRLSL